MSTRDIAECIWEKSMDMDFYDYDSSREDDIAYIEQMLIDKGRAATENYFRNWAYNQYQNL